MFAIRSLACLLLLFCLPCLTAVAASNSPASIPYLDIRGQEGYRQFLGTMSPRAFAIAPGGAWGWSTEAVSAPHAEREALANCQANTEQRCQLYAINDAIVFDNKQWQRSLGPYKKAAEATKARIGTGLGERFPDLKFFDTQNKSLHLSDFRGQVVVLHFWGSWCPPCQRELPDLSRLIDKTGSVRDLRYIFLQVREPFDISRAWAKRTKLKLPLYDSGVTNSGDGRFRLADGTTLEDRAIARAFPTTYVIDKHGLVVFSHVGPVHNWYEYAPLLSDVATRSGK